MNYPLITTKEGSIFVRPPDYPVYIKRIGSPEFEVVEASGVRRTDKLFLPLGNAEYYGSQVSFLEARAIGALVSNGQWGTPQTTMFRGNGNEATDFYRLCRRLGWDISKPEIRGKDQYTWIDIYHAREIVTNYELKTVSSDGHLMLRIPPYITSREAVLGFLSGYFWFSLREYRDSLRAQIPMHQLANELRELLFSQNIPSRYDRGYLSVSGEVYLDALSTLAVVPDKYTTPTPIMLNFPRVVWFQDRPGHLETVAGVGLTNRIDEAPFLNTLLPPIADGKILPARLHHHWISSPQIPVFPDL